MKNWDYYLDLFNCLIKTKKAHPHSNEDKALNKCSLFIVCGQIEFYATKKETGNV